MVLKEGIRRGSPFEGSDSSIFERVDSEMRVSRYSLTFSSDESGVTRSTFIERTEPERAREIESVSRIVVNGKRRELLT
jgi:hypothetical protein